MVKESPLAAAFRAELGFVEPLDADSEGLAALEATISDALARGCAAFPGLEVEGFVFARHLARSAGGAEPAALEGLAIEDLYLACACIGEVDGAVAAFRARCDTTIRGAIGRVVKGADLAEVEQRFLEETLVGTVTKPAKIRSFAGRAPLERWLGVAAHRTALMWLREGQTEARARDGAAAETNLDAGVHPELAYLKERYRGDFARALTEALDRAPDRERALLRLHVVNGVSMEKIGKMHGVTQATASRWLAAARERLLDDIKATLGQRLGVSAGELASIAGLVASRLDLSLSMLLRSR